MGAFREAIELAWRAHNKSPCADRYPEGWPRALALIAAADAIKCLIADKTYDANNLHRLLADQRVTAIIPSTMSRSHLSTTQSYRTDVGSPQGLPQDRHSI
jgi:hypothetical protein